MSLFKRDDLVAHLCRRSGKWYVHNRRGPLHWVCACDEKSMLLIRVSYRPGYFLMFEAELPIRFSLENPPSGLFGRVLLRSGALKLASWRMDIRESCEAVLYLSVQMPEHRMSGEMFDEVCREMRDEVLALHQELRDKFHYTVGGPVQGGYHHSPPQDYSRRLDSHVARIVDDSGRNR